MSALAKIEIVLFLRDVDLFQFCNAEEILRIASIARERQFPSGRTIYKRKDLSEALYCVMEGSVRLEGAAGAAHTVGPKGTFGVLDILSGRLRAAGATAEADSLTLAIDAEDFFDLLSNNVEIVKALFRRLIPASPDGGGSPLQ